MRGLNRAYHQEVGPVRRSVLLSGTTLALLVAFSATASAASLNLTVTPGAQDEYHYSADRNSFDVKATGTADGAAHLEIFFLLDVPSCPPTSAEAGPLGSGSHLQKQLQAGAFTFKSAGWAFEKPGSYHACSYLTASGDGRTTATSFTTVEYAAPPPDVGTRVSMEFRNDLDTLNSESARFQVRCVGGQNGECDDLTWVTTVKVSDAEKRRLGLPSTTLLRQSDKDDALGARMSRAARKALKAKEGPDGDRLVRVHALVTFAVKSPFVRSVTRKATFLTGRGRGDDKYFACFSTSELYPCHKKFLYGD